MLFFLVLFKNELNEMVFKRLVRAFLVHSGSGARVVASDCIAQVEVARVKFNVNRNMLAEKGINIIAAD